MLQHAWNLLLDKGWLFGKIEWAFGREHQEGDFRMQFTFLSDTFVKKGVSNHQRFSEKAWETFHLRHFLDLRAGENQQHLLKYFFSGLISVLQCYEILCYVAFKHLLFCESFSLVFLWKNFNLKLIFQNISICCFFCLHCENCRLSQLEYEVYLHLTGEFK